MVHGRMIRPAVAGAVPVKVDEASIKDIPGAQVVWHKGFLGVVAPQGVGRDPGRRRSSRSNGRRSSRRSRTRRALRPHPQGAGAQARRSRSKNGNVDDAFKTAAKVIEAEYEWPFQSHASMGPACALVEIKDGKVDLLERHAEVALRAAGPRRHARRAGRQRARDLDDRAPAPTAATTPTTARRTRRCWRRRSASRCACNTCATKAPAGTRRARPRSTRRARRSTPTAR